MPKIVTETLSVEIIGGTHVATFPSSGFLRTAKERRRTLKFDSKNAVSETPFPHRRVRCPDSLVDGRPSGSLSQRRGTFTGA